MATLAEIQQKANSRLATFWTSLVTKQEAYHAKHGKYFQLLVSPTSSVVDGLDSNFSTRHPSDEPYEIDVDFAFTEQIPFNIEVYESVGPNGQSFTGRVQIELTSGDIYKRERTYPSNEDSGWYLYVEEQQ